MEMSFSGNGSCRVLVYLRIPSLAVAGLGVVQASRGDPTNPSIAFWDQLEEQRVSQSSDPILSLSSLLRRPMRVFILIQTLVCWLLYVGRTAIT